MSMNKRDYLLPSALLCQNYRLLEKKPFFIANKIDHLIQDNFYRSIEISNISDKKERQQISRALSTNKDGRLKNLIVWFTEFFTEHKIDIHDLDEGKRKKNVETIKKLIDEAAETGAHTVAFTGGSNVSVLERSDAYKALIRTLGEVCDYAAKAKLEVFIEPCDCYADQQKLLGQAQDTQEVMQLLRKDHKNLSLVFDTAHVALNREPPFKTLEMLGPFLRHFHLSNAVLDFDSPLFGDNHIAPGEPGFLTAKRAEKLLSHAHKIGICANEGVTVAVEYMQTAEHIDRPDRTFQIATDFLKQVQFEFVLS
ncbi:MAG: sugar phosphate isomerase/epimerase [Succinivibrio sp.]|nr:sugar phosphate isomerase/epimerase [Succinivibrio sp.]